jgi:cation transport ATPase
MQLSEEQIQYLFRFTEKKMVHWYDLQVELVDHLASNIEEAMNEDPTLSFESALEKVYKRFGIFGFAKVVQEKSAQLEKASRKTWRKAVMEYLSWPKIAFLAMTFAILWQLSQWLDTRILMTAFVILYFLASFTMVYRFHRKRKKEKRLMMLQVNPGGMSVGVFFYEWYLISYNQVFSELLFCVLATLGILFSIASYQVYKNVKEQAMKMYPEAFA